MSQLRHTKEEQNNEARNIFIAYTFAFIGYYTYRIIELAKFMRTQEAKWKGTVNNAR